MRVVLLGLSLWLSGCALISPLHLDTHLIESLPTQHEITDVPFIEQADYQCGPASLAMVLNYYGQETTPDTLVPWVFTPNAEGSFPAEMDAVIRQQGFISYPVNSLEQLLLEVQAGHPVLVLQNLGVFWYPMWHFAVVVGFDMEDKEVILRSGDLAQKHTGFHLFHTTWKRSQRWGRVIMPADKLPETAQPLPFLKAAADLQQTGPASAALTAFQTAHKQWPNNPIALFGLANQYYSLQQYSLSQHHFEALIELQPNHAKAWNNYGYSLIAQGCKQQAMDAVACAVQLNPEQANYIDSAEEMRNWNIPDTAHCKITAHCPQH